MGRKDSKHRPEKAQTRQKNNAPIFSTCYKIDEKAMIRNRYNQIPHPVPKHKQLRRHNVKQHMWKVKRSAHKVHILASICRMKELQCHHSNKDCIKKKTKKKERKKKKRKEKRKTKKQTKTTTTKKKTTLPAGIEPGSPACERRSITNAPHVWLICSQNTTTI